MSYYHTKFSVGTTRPKRGRSPAYKFIRILLILVLLLASGIGYYVYTAMFAPNTWTPDGEPVSVFIEEGASYDEVKKDLYSKGLIVDRGSFEWLAARKDYPERVKEGHYLVKSGMTNNELINTLRAGLQTPVNVIFNNIRVLPQLAHRVSEQLSFDSTTLMNLFRDTTYLSKYDFTPKTVKSMFIPNTYEFYWTVNAEEFFERMNDEYNKFWTEEKLQQAEQIELTPLQVSTLASIVEKETSKNDEKARIAGVYMNRLERGWRLQADPTLIYALGDFSIKRVLNKHKRVDSPYNTYLHRGLPPGPICLPSISSINAVLNFENHEYMYFCAKADFSGYHAFARTNAQHQENAREYQRALNEQKIYE